METNEVKKVVYLKDLTKVTGTVSDYEYRIDDDTDVEIRIEEGISLQTIHLYIVLA